MPKTARTPPPAEPIPGRRSAQVAGWSVVVVACGHLLTVAASALSPADPATERAQAGLRTVPVALPGPHHTLDQLFIGYSMMMGTLALAIGLLRSRLAT
jgi:hypothetical protein